jgi:hypothetical protein
MATWPSRSTSSWLTAGSTVTRCVIDHHRGLALAQGLDQLDEGLLALFVQARVGLVEHHELRVAVDGARQATRWRWPPESTAPSSPMRVS